MKRTAVRAALAALFLVSVTVGPAPMASAQAPSGRVRVVVKTVFLLSPSELTAVSCVTEGCTAVQPNPASSVQIINGDPLPSRNTDLYVTNGISCLTLEQCVVVGFDLGGDGAIFQLTDGTANVKREILEDTGINMSAVACTSTAWCVAVGNVSTGGGVVVPISDGQAAPPIPVPANLDAVAGSSAASCVAVGSAIVPITDGAPGPPEPEPGIATAVACPAPGSCVAVANGNEVLPIINGVPSAPETVPGNVGLGGIACSGPTTCVAVGGTPGGGAIVPIINDVPGTVHVLPAGYLDAVSCSTSTSCVAVGTSSTLAEGLVADIEVQPYRP
jgi:hypothetical protein